MAFSGGVFTRVYSWATDKVNAIKITASRMDTEMDGMATGLSACVLKDGTQTITANITMSGYKFTSYGSTSAASARTDVPATGQIQDGFPNYAGASSGTNTVTLTPAPAITAYAVGQRFSFKAGGTNTGATTLNISAVGAGAVQKSGVALVANDIVTDAIVEVVVSATTPVFQIVSRANNTAVQTFTNGIVFGNETMTAYDEVALTLGFTPQTGSVTAYTSQGGKAVRVGNGVMWGGVIVVNTLSV